MTDVPKPTEAPVFRDKAGWLLQPGDLVVYGHALGRCAALQYGKVISIDYAEKASFDYYKNTHVWPVRLKVRGVSDGYGQKPALLKLGTLQYGSRVLKVDRTQVAVAFLDVLDTLIV
jgi:hypothetical protein